jgi:hypothetical protein
MPHSVSRTRLVFSSPEPGTDAVDDVRETSFQFSRPLLRGPLQLRPVQTHMRQLALKKGALVVPLLNVSAHPRLSTPIGRAAE